MPVVDLFPIEGVDEDGCDVLFMHAFGSRSSVDIYFSDLLTSCRNLSRLGNRVGSGSGLSGPFSEVAVKMPMEYWLPFGLVLLFQILCIKVSPFMISYFAL